MITADPKLTNQFREFVSKKATVLKVASSLREGARKLARKAFDLVLIETETLYRNFKGFIPRKYLLSGNPPAVVFSKQGSIRHAVRAMRAGAFDYLPHPPENAEEFGLLVDRALNTSDELHRSVEGVTPLEGFVTKDHRLLSVCRVAADVADSQVVLLIEGERGTGRTFLARKVHENSNRSLGAFVEFDCDVEEGANLANQLFGGGSELCASAGRAPQGKYRLADGGTLLLNEVSKAPPAVIAQLLKVAHRENKSRDDGNADACNVRLMMSDSEANEKVVQEICKSCDFDGAGPVKLRIPALRERVGDIPLLARYFANLVSTRNGYRRIRLVPDAVDVLVHYPWPGNVKELKEIIGRGALLARNGILSAECLQLERQDATWNDGWGSAGENKGVKPLKAALQKPEREYILAALRRTGWNKKRAALELNVSRSTLYKKISKYRLDELGAFSESPPGDRERWVRVLGDHQFAD